MMGEAKRRKQFDSTWGKHQDNQENKHKVYVTKSQITDNFLICIDNGYVYDSAKNYDDAVIVKNQLEQILKNCPYKKILTSSDHGFVEWLHKKGYSTTNVNSYGLLIVNKEIKSVILKYSDK